MNRQFLWAGITSFTVLWSGVAVGQTISSFNPPVGSPGDQVIISGSGFSTGTIKVYFSNQQLAAALPTADTLITAYVPNGATTGPITVQRNAQPPVSSAGIFTVIGHGPYITDVSPTAGSPNDLVIITGVHLANVTSVKFNGVASSDPSPNSAGTQISLHVPAGAKSGPISVTTPFGTSNSPAPFTVIGPGPYITGFSPTFGNAGTRVYVTGVHFVNATWLLFNGAPGANFFVSSDTLIQVDAPPKVTTGPLQVFGPLGTNTTSTNFYGPPVISGFSPATGRAGTNMVITGTNLAGATTVLYGGTPASVFNASDNNILYVVVPAGAASGKLQVFTPGFSVTTKSNFTFQPTISGFAPGSGAASTSVTVFGANLNEGLSHVKFNNVDATFGSPQADRVTATVPAGATSGPVSVTTSNGTYTSTANFFLPAIVSSFTPSNSAPATQITIKGQNFLGTTAVKFNGFSASFAVVDNATLIATVPTGVTTGPITVSTPANTATSGAQLFYGFPVVNSFSPAHGLPGTAVSILGTNFTGASAVRFNGVNASSFTVVNNGLIQATVPLQGSTGPITVVAPAGSGFSSSDFVIDLVSDLAVNSSDTPDPVFWSSNLVYTIVVTNRGPFDAPNVVLSDTLPGTLTYKSVTTTRGSVGVNGNLVTANLGTLVVASSAVVTLTVAPTALGEVTNIFTVAGDHSDPVSADNTNVVTTLVLPLPVLGVQVYSPSQLKISWPSMLTNYSLEYKTSLQTSYPWSNVASQPIVSGTNIFVIEPIVGPLKFYRLAD